MYIVGIDIAKRFHEAAIIDCAGNIGWTRPPNSAWKPLGITGCRSTRTFAKQSKPFT